MLLLPIVVPALLASVQATAGILTGELDRLYIDSWIRLLIAYDILFTCASLLLFGPALHAE